MNGPFCSCMKVVYQPEHLSNGAMRERWVCVNCGMEFVKRAMIRQEFQNLESDLQAARAELEAAREQADELEKMNRHLSSFLEEAAHAAASGENPKKYLATSAPTVLRDRIKELWEALTTLRRQIDGAETINLRDGEMGKITTYKLLEVKP
jgi:DNA repair exonuclease SbcCD ATPase subunit